MSAGTPEPAVEQESFEEEALGQAYDTRLLLRLWPYVRPFWRQIALTLLLFLPIFALELAPAWIVKSGIDQVAASVSAERIADVRGDRAVDVVSQAVQPLEEQVDLMLGVVLDPPGGWSVGAWLAFVYLLVTMVLGALQYFYQVLMASTGQYAMRELRRHVFEHIETLQMSYFDVIPVGRLVTRATNDVENVAEMFAQGLVALITDVIKMAGYAAILFVLSAKLALWSFAIVPLLGVAAVFFRLKVHYY